MHGLHKKEPARHFPFDATRVHPSLRKSCNGNRTEARQVGVTMHGLGSSYKAVYILL